MQIKPARERLSPFRQRVIMLTCPQANKARARVICLLSWLFKTIYCGIGEAGPSLETLGASEVSELDVGAHPIEEFTETSGALCLLARLGLCRHTPIGGGHHLPLCSNRNRRCLGIMENFEEEV